VLRRPGLSRDIVSGYCPTQPEAVIGPHLLVRVLATAGGWWAADIECEPVPPFSWLRVVSARPESAE
jgi:hypothetical protein